MSGIKAGDLVMVVRGAPCCGAMTKFNGTIFRVEYLDIDRGGTCKYCHVWSEGGTIAKHPGGKFVDVSRLIRIDPPALPESIQDEREVTA